MTILKGKSFIFGLLSFTVLAYCFQQVYFEFKRYLTWREAQDLIELEQEILVEQEEQKKVLLNKQQTIVQRMPTKMAEDMGTECLICMCNPSNIILVPCNHLCMCGDCFLNLVQLGNKNVQCPVCRYPVDLDHKIRINYQKDSEIELFRTKTVVDFLES